MNRRTFAVQALAIALLSGCAGASSSPSLTGTWVVEGHPDIALSGTGYYTKLVFGPKTVVTFFVGPSTIGLAPNTKPNRFTLPWDDVGGGKLRMTSNGNAAIYKYEIKDQRLYLTQTAGSIDVGTQVFDRKSS